MTTPISHPADQQLIQAAHDQYESGDFREALVLAHIAIEVTTDQALAAWINRVQPVGLREWLFRQIENSHNLGSEKIRALYESVAELKISAEPFWPMFLTCNTLRNRAMHDGTDVSDQQAKDAITNAEQVVNYLKEHLPA